MTEKNVLLGFVLATTILFMNSNFLFVGIVIDLLVIAGYLLSKYLYMYYQIDGKYLEKIYMTPLYLTLIMATLTTGIFSIISRYAPLYSNFSTYNALPIAIKTYIFAEIIFLIIFTYFLFKTILFDIMKIDIKKEKKIKPLPQTPSKITKTAKIENMDSKDKNQDATIVFNDETKELTKEEQLYPYQIKKLPVVVIVSKE
ncbi:hypothetical protein GQ473_04475 [archaeon]|nr:hypothetical protein [archaeon]